MLSRAKRGQVANGRVLFGGEFVRNRRIFDATSRAYKPVDERRVGWPASWMGEGTDLVLVLAVGQRARSLSFVSSRQKQRRVVVRGHGEGGRRLTEVDSHHDDPIEPSFHAPYF